MSDVITGIIPSVIRRVFGTAVLYLLGSLLLYICAVEPPAQLHLAFVLIVIGGFSIFAGYKMWNATGFMIELTEDVLRMSDGTVICEVDNIAKVDRSVFAFKPSNGFLLTLKARAPKAWVPGLWWRVGKRVGIGGLTPGSESKIMADTIAAMMAERQGLVDIDDR